MDHAITVHALLLHACPNFPRMCHNALLLRPSGCACHRLALLSVPHPWSCCVPVLCGTAPGSWFGLYGCATSATIPCAFHFRVRCLGDVPLGALIVQGFTQKEEHEGCIGHHRYKPKEEVSRLLSWCCLPSRSWPLHSASLAYSMKSGCGCRWVPMSPASARAHTTCTCCPAPFSLLCIYLPLVLDFRWHCPHRCWMPLRGSWREPCLSAWTSCNPSPPIARDFPSLNPSKLPKLKKPYVSGPQLVPLDCPFLLLQSMLSWSFVLHWKHALISFNLQFLVMGAYFWHLKHVIFLLFVLAPLEIKAVEATSMVPGSNLVLTKMMIPCFITCSPFVVRSWEPWRCSRTLYVGPSTPLQWSSHWKSSRLLLEDPVVFTHAWWDSPSSSSLVPSSIQLAEWATSECGAARCCGCHSPLPVWLVVADDWRSGEDMEAIWDSPNLILTGNSKTLSLK